MFLLTENTTGDGQRPGGSAPVSRAPLALQTDP